MLTSTILKAFVLFTNDFDCSQRYVAPANTRPLLDAKLSHDGFLGAHSFVMILKIIRSFDRQCVKLEIIRINADDPNETNEEIAEEISDYVNEKISDLMDEVEDAKAAESLQEIYGQQVLLNGRKIY